MSLVTSNSVCSPGKKKAKKKRKAVVGTGSVEVAHSTVDQGRKAGDGVDKVESQECVQVGKITKITKATTKGRQKRLKRWT